MDNNSGTTNSRSGKATRGESRSDKNTEINQESNHGQPKSLSSIIGQSLAQESQEAVERVFSQFNAYITEGKNYINENPKEAAALAVSLGVAAWALSCTKPGRKAFEVGAALAVPQISKWLSSNFSSALKH